MQARWWRRKAFLPAGLVLVAALVVLAACGQPAQQGTSPADPAPEQGPDAASGDPGEGARDRDDQPRRGGTLRVAIEGEPPTLDVHWSGADMVWSVGWHIFETVLTLDETWNPIPNLADFEVLDDGLRIVLNLRPDVKFHNGDVMDAGDVAASLERWLAKSSIAQSAFQHLDRIETPDARTVVLHLTEPSATALMALAFHDHGAYVMPKEVIEAAGEDQVKEYIGTGPYQFVEWRSDQYIRVVRFEDYNPIPGGTRGYGGTKHAWVDEILFIPTPDAMTRLAALEAGDLDITDIPEESYTRINRHPDLQGVIQRAGTMPAAVFNTRQGVMADPRLRLAALLALDMEPIMQAAFGDPDLYELQPSFMPLGNVWNTDAGRGLYDTPDLERARRLVAEAGYQGEPIIWITTSEYDYMYKNALVAKEQWHEKLNLNVEVQVVDWATLNDLRAQPDAYDIFSTALTLKPDPTMIAFVTPNWPGWWDTPRKNELVARLTTEVDPDERLRIWQETEALIYEEVPAIKFGDKAGTVGARADVRNVWTGPAQHYWNVWLDR